MDEFALIRRYFQSLTPAVGDVALGIGDDGALLRTPLGCELVVTVDTLVAGRHFPPDTAPFDIGWKSLAVSLSDLAAMGATPRWFVLALTLPEPDETWLAAFASGLKALAEASEISLVGGDTTRGPLSITITAMGSVPAGAAMRRSGAKAGDAICVTGTLGDAALALCRLSPEPSFPRRRERFAGSESTRKPGALQPGEAHGCVEQSSSDPSAPPEPPDYRFRGNDDDLKDFRFLRKRLDRPTPRLSTGIALRELAHAAIDLSDGLAGDLQHILDASGVGAEIDCARLPMSDAFARRSEDRQRLALQLSGGDDYEICVCIPAERVDEARARLDVALTVIGRITAEPGLRWLDSHGERIELDLHGYRHFDD